MIDHSSLDCIVRELVLSILIRHCPLTDWYLQLRLCIVRYKIDELIESFRNDGDGNDNGKKQQVYIGTLSNSVFERRTSTGSGNENLIASRHIKRKKTSLPVHVRRSKTSLLKLPISKTITLHMHHAFFVNCTFSGGREHKTTIFYYWLRNMSFRIQLQKNSATFAFNDM